MNKIIRLNENELIQMVNESVNAVLNESFNHYKSQKVADAIRQHGIGKWGNLSTHYVLTQLKDDNFEGVDNIYSNHSIELGDGTYLHYNLNNNSIARDYNSSVSNFSKKAADAVRPNNEFAAARDFNHISDNYYSREHYHPMTSRAKTANDLRNNPYFRKWKNAEVNTEIGDNGWNRKNAERAMNNLRNKK